MIFAKWKRGRSRDEDIRRRMLRDTESYLNRHLDRQGQLRASRTRHQRERRGCEATY